MPIKVCLAGATGWVGSALSKAILDSKEFELVSALGKKTAGKKLGDVLGIPNLSLQITNSIDDALLGNPDILIDYTHPEIVMEHVKKAINKKVPVVIGTTGISEEGFEEIDRMAIKNSVGVLGSGNFAITAVLLKLFAQFAAKHVPNWEIFDYATDHKQDAPSGTASELANSLSKIGVPKVRYPVEYTIGKKEARGAEVNGSQIHSVRLPCFVFGYEIIFGLKHERLSMRHEADYSAEPYVLGTLYAAKRVGSFIGLKRGLDSIMEF